VRCHSVSDVSVSDVSVSDVSVSDVSVSDDSVRFHSVRFHSVRHYSVRYDGRSTGHVRYLSVVCFLSNIQVIFMRHDLCACP